ncbi:hypothetical protein PMAYCL1PPCAC_03088, partial [Pristionchus mayeri]
RHPGMTASYLPIGMSETVQAGARQKILKSMACIFGMLIATYFIASHLMRNVHTDSTVSRDARADFKSLSVSSHNDTFRPPIGGLLKCNKRSRVSSPSSPIDANEVRPADIKYIAALGDSFATGFLSYSGHAVPGDSARNVVGNSFITGGDRELDTHLTLANIFRVLNPNITGLSTGLGTNEANTGMNVAAPGMWMDDLQRQARELIRRLEKYSAESLREDWKLINIFIGGRDISGFCMGDGDTMKQEYKSNLTESIEILQTALPKTIISIIGIPNFNFLWGAGSIIEKSNDMLMGGFALPCNFANYELLIQRRIEEYREANIEIVSESEKNSRKDHVVIIQYIFDHLWEPPRKPDGSFNIEFYAQDAFHMSNYGNSLVAKQLWNQLIAPSHSKITNNEMFNDESPELACPDMRCPFIRTPSNSVSCHMSDENVVAGV